jgi:hypothetical protein
MGASGDHDPPARALKVTTSDSAALAELLHEAEEHHGQYEPTAPKHHWWDWYAAYVVAREQGRTPDQAYGDASAALAAAQG